MLEGEVSSLPFPMNTKLVALAIRIIKIFLFELTFQTTNRDIP